MPKDYIGGNEIKYTTWIFKSSSRWIPLTSQKKKNLKGVFLSIK